MATAFQEAFADIVGDDDFGSSATYNGVGIIVSTASFGQTSEQSPAVRLSDAVIYVSSSDVPNPKKQDRVVLNGTTYNVVALEGCGSGASWMLNLNKAIVQ